MLGNHSSGSKNDRTKDHDQPSHSNLNNTVTKPIDQNLITQPRKRSFSKSIQDKLPIYFTSKQSPTKRESNETNSKRYYGQWDAWDDVPIPTELSRVLSEVYVKRDIKENNILLVEDEVCIDVDDSIDDCGGGFEERGYQKFDENGNLRSARRWKDRCNIL